MVENIQQRDYSAISPEFTPKNLVQVVTNLRNSGVSTFRRNDNGDDESNSLRLIENITLLSFLPEREEDLEPTQRADRL